AELIMGQAPKGDSYNTEGQGVPLIAGASDLGETNPNPSRFTTSPTKVGQSGDIILCVRATIGDLNWSDSEYCYGRGVAGVRATKVDSQFLYYALAHSKTDLVDKGRGATFKQVSKKDIKALPIPTPSADEQRRL